MSKLRVSYSPLSERIFAGRPIKSGDGWSANKTDVTSDVLFAIIKKVGVGNVINVSENGVNKFEIEVREIKESNNG